MNNWPKNCRCQ